MTFADSFFFLALLNRNDRAHLAAQEANRTRRGRIVTTQWVLMEVGDALSAVLSRVHFLLLYELLSADTEIEIIAATSPQFERGLELYRARPDKAWSLTDCISFTVMQERGINEALTGDQHFRQAGFVTLL